MDAEQARQELREALGRQPPELPCKYFYDDRGSALYEEITRLPEYYPTRTEETILERIAGEVVRRVRPRELVELGSGAGRKIRTLLDAMGAEGRRERCVLLDVNARFLAESAERLRAAYEGLDVRTVRGDFTRDLWRLGGGAERLVLFFAGTIGNLLPDEARRFLRHVAGLLGPGSAFLVGVDLVKPTPRLEAAYDDAAGVTAEFNRNILRVVNARFGADFDPDAFEHVAFYDEARARIEMRLRATRAQRVRVRDLDLVLDLPAGGEIRTEVSCKHTRPGVEEMARAAGLRVDAWWTDEEALFALALLRRVDARPASGPG